MKKIYLLSDNFDYTKMICADAGPEYADNMLWSKDYLKNISQYQECINIIDTRISHSECEQIKQYILSHKNTIFLLTVTDPQLEHLYKWKDSYYQFLFDLKNIENVFYLSKYLPVELVKELDESTNYKKVIFIPYPFADKYQTNQPFSQRQQKILLSGATDPKFYPHRYKFWEATLSNNVISRLRYRTSSLVRNHIHFLGHPDYPDIGAKLRHDIIGEKYINYLSQFLYMFLSPSKWSLELLKYSECAYAKCVPVGEMPASFSQAMKEPFLEIDFQSINKSVERILSIPLDELSERSDKYYQAFQLERNPQLLNDKLDNFLDVLF